MLKTLLGVILLLGLFTVPALAAPPGGPVGTTATGATADLTTAAATTQAATQPDEGKSAAEALIHKLWLGGWTVFFQLLISVAGLAYAVERLINLRRGTIVPKGLAAEADRLFQQGKFGEIEKLCKSRPSTLSRMILAVLAHRHESAPEVASIAGDVGTPELKLHLQRAYPIAVVATLEPLLGLFGTVWGMIGAFDKVAMAGSMGDPAILADEIALALVTTAVGLAIAIPMLALYHYFKSRTTSYAIELQAQVGHLINGWIKRKEPAHA